MKTDTELERDVQDVLHDDPGLVRAHIGVAARKGVVTLRGTVPSNAEQWAAERLAASVEDVKAVVNHLEVLPADVAG